MSIQPFNMFHQNLHSRMIVEASAGTGKTYNIVGLFIRLLIQKRLNVNEILVVTFTRMATRELKERLLSRLKKSLKVSIQDDYKGSDPFLRDLVQFCDQYADSHKLLEEAIRNFDEAQVHTIHGFCQKVLMEEALVSGMPFEFDVSQTDDLLRESVQDFWRSFIDQFSETEEGRYFISQIMEFGTTPDELLENLKPLFSKPYADPEPSNIEIDVISELKAIIEKRNEISALWREDRDAILEELVRSDISGMGKKTVEKNGDKFDRFIEDQKYTLVPPDNFEKFTSSYLNKDEHLKKDGRIKPSHPLFDQCEEYSLLVSRITDIKTSFLLHAFQKIRELRMQKSRKSVQLTYDDLLTFLDQALRKPETGKQLAETLRKKYPVALVDEFQDTDPIQYRIFDKIYNREECKSSVFMMIGDPKQAIYGFRGADVYTYLRARDSVEAENSFTLSKNFRSSDGLISGINTLFTSSASPFIEENISFSEAQKGEQPDEKHLNYLHDTKAPLRINYRDGVQNKAESKRHVFQLAATQVAALIDKGKREEVKIGDTPLQAGDIAILVTTNRDAETLKEYLKSRGVDSVTYSREQVFESREADRLRHLMSAVLYPSDRRRVARSLVSGFFGSEIEHLHELYQNEERWQNLVEKLRRLNERWHEAGFYPMFRKFLFEEKALTNLAKIHNSERVITNLQQLAEICSYAEQEHKFDPSGLYNWFYKQAANPQENDEQTLLLESDRQLVKISTIHNSKGLEFPVVFLPTLWDAKDLGRKGQPVAEYHDPENRYHAMLNVDQGKSITRSKAEFRSHLESVAEEVRKTYVALTRAKYECRVFWSATKNSHLSGLGAALLGKEYVTHCIEKMESLEKSDRISQQFFRNKFEQFSKRLPGIISFHDPHPEESNGGKRQEISPENVRESLTLSSITLPESLYSNKQLYSFSSLIHNDPERVAEPDYDQWLEKYIERANKDRDSGEEEATIFSFPKGALAGTLIHKLFEHSEFDFRDPGNKLGFIRDNLLEYGFDEKWIQPLHNMMINVSKADYSGLNMNKVSPENLMREMEFYFDSAQLTVEDFIQVIRSGQVSAQSGRVDVKGYVTGFIDLIVRQHGVYYILDYKSNYLGDSLQDYQKEQLQEVMISTGYDIQYHLYTLALKKYLESRDPDFDYEKHFGGTYYLFVRGIRANSGSGIYQHKPELKILESLEKLLYRDREVQGG